MNINSKDVDALPERKKNGEEVFIIPNDLKGLAGTEAIATLGFHFTRYDATFYGYFYEFDRKIYKFGWETPYDETHRAYAKGRKAEWYDSIRVGQKFKIKVDAECPSRHYILDNNFSEMNKGVDYFGCENM